MKNYDIDSFQATMQEDIRWRKEQLTYIKQNAVIGSIPEPRLEVIVRYSPVLIYALFEGFVTKITTEYINTINRVPSRISEYIDNVINHELEVQYNYHKLSTKVDERVGAAHDIKEFFYKPTVHLSQKIETASNVNLKVLNSILKVYGIETIEEREPLLGDVKFAGYLHKLLRVRNSIAHGEVTVKVTVEDVDSFANNLEYIFDFLEERYLKSLKNKTFLAV